MYTNKLFTKDMISWQCTIVKFRNGYLGLAVSDKILDKDNDGNDAFMIYDVESKSFMGSMYLCCYDDNLRYSLYANLPCGMPSEGVSNHETTSIQMYNDTNWDVVNVIVYPYASDAFTMLTGDKELCWSYKINTY